MWQTQLDTLTNQSATQAPQTPIPHLAIIIRPAVPPDVTALIGFPRAAEIIAIGEESAQEALPRIKAMGVVQSN